MDKQAAFRGIVLNSPGTHDGVLILREEERERGRGKEGGKKGEKGREGKRERKGGWEKKGRSERQTE